MKRKSIIKRIRIRLARAISPVKISNGNKSLIEDLLLNYIKDADGYFKDITLCSEAKKTKDEVTIELKQLSKDIYNL